MKRQTATLLLSMSLLVSMTGCTEKETTQSTADTNETEASSSETEETETTTTSESTEASSEESSSEETSTSETIPFTPVEVELSSDLQFLEFSYDPAVRAYGLINRQLDGNNGFVDIEYYCDQYHLVTEGYEPLRVKIDEICASKLQASEDFFNRNLPDLSDREYFTSFDTRMYFTRADEQICSLKVETEGSDYLVDYYTFDSATAAPITLDQIITDRSLFADTLTTYSAFAEDSKEEMESVAELIRKGDDVPFVLYQNGILFSNEDFEFFISAMELGQCINLDYFTSSTEYYSLYSDFNKSIKWDIDKDGVLDNISLITQCAEEESFAEKLTLVWNDQSFDFADESGYSFGYIDYFYLTQTDNGFYLYVNCCEYDDLYETTEIYHFENQSFVHVGYTGHLDTIPYNPDELMIIQWGDIFGTGLGLQNCSVIGNNGIPTIKSDLIRKRNIRNCACTAVDFTLPACNKDGELTGKDITIPADTCVRMEGIDAKNNIAIMATLKADGTDDQYFQIGVALQEEYNLYVFFYQDTEYDYAGQRELFMGLAYGG